MIKEIQDALEEKYVVVDARPAIGGDFIVLCRINGNDFTPFGTWLFSPSTKLNRGHYFQKRKDAEKDFEERFC